MHEHEKSQPEPLVSFGPYRLDVENFQLWRGVQEVRLTGKAFAVLRYLVEHAGELATKDELFAAAWPETVVSEATLVSGIQELRQALRDDAKNPRYIETVHRRGYRFIGKVVSQEEVVSSQHSVVSRPEPSTTEPSRESSVRSLESKTAELGSLEEAQRKPGETPQRESRISLHSIRATEPPLPDKPSIVVLPFDNMSNDPTQEYFSDGLTEVLTSDRGEVMAAQTPAVGMARKLTAIFSTDVAGYSRLMGDDEEATIRTLTAYREVISSLIQHHRGRVVDSPGDNLLAEFASVVDAVRCAVEIQHDLKAKNTELPEQRQMQFRIGINLGDVIVEGERLYGDGVNIAARLESLAIPGGICISGTVYDQVETKLALTYEDLGEQTVKNMTRPVRVYRMVLKVPSPPVEQASSLPAARRAAPPEEAKRQKANVEGRAGVARQKWALMAVAGVLLIAGVIVIVRSVPFSSFRNPPAPSVGGQSPIRNQEAQPPPLPLPDKPSIIVLPLANLSADPEQDYFSDGLTDVLTGDLSRISSLFVISRNSAFTYKGKAVKVQDVGREMGVRYVLEGSVQKADQQVRITAQLIETTTGYHLWSEQYDRPLKEIFALQDEIVQKIVTTLKLQLTLQEQGHVVHKHTDNLAAYDAVLRGQEYYWRTTKEANAQARQLYEKAIELDPQYAEAYAWLGYTYWVEWALGNVDPQTLERMFEMAQKAIALDDSLPVAHSLLSIVYAQKQQYDQAIAAGERAVALDPNDADSYVNQALVLNLAGRPEEALQSAEQAMRLNPRSPPWYLNQAGWAYRMTGRYAEAIAAFKEVISRNPNFIHAYFELAGSYLLQWIAQQSPAAQTLAPAVAAGQRALALNDSLHWSHLTLGYIHLYQQQYEQALAEMERGVALAPTEAVSYAGLAVVLSYMGRTEDALEAAAQALRLKPLIADAHLDSVGAAYAVAGRPEEALAPLKQFIARYPNILSAHLTLATVYSELGREAEARAEVAEVLRLNPRFSLEVHKQRVPIKDPAMLERHIAALRRAGLK